MQLPPNRNLTAVFNEAVRNDNPAAIVWLKKHCPLFISNWRFNNLFISQESLVQIAYECAIQRKYIDCMYALAPRADALYCHRIFEAIRSSRDARVVRAHVEMGLPVQNLASLNNYLADDIDFTRFILTYIKSDLIHLVVESMIGVEHVGFLQSMLQHASLGFDQNYDELLNRSGYRLANWTLENLCANATELTELLDRFPVNICNRKRYSLTRGEIDRIIAFPGVERRHCCGLLEIVDIE